MTISTAQCKLCKAISEDRITNLSVSEITRHRSRITGTRIILAIGQKELSYLISCTEVRISCQVTVNPYLKEDGGTKKHAENVV